MRVPSPAARTIAVSGIRKPPKYFVLLDTSASLHKSCVKNGWGSRIRTHIPGTKNPCPNRWTIPQCNHYVGFVRNSIKCISLAKQMLHKLHQEQELLKSAHLR